MTGVLIKGETTQKDKDIQRRRPGENEGGDESDSYKPRDAGGYQKLRGKRAFRGSPTNLDFSVENYENKFLLS